MADEPIYLNGASQKFLMEWAELKEKMDNHLTQSDEDRKDLKKVRELVARHDLVIKIVGLTLLAVIPVILGWIFHG